MEVLTRPGWQGVYIIDNAQFDFRKDPRKSNGILFNKQKPKFIADVIHILYSARKSRLLDPIGLSSEFVVGNNQFTPI